MRESRQAARRDRLELFRGLESHDRTGLALGLAVLAALAVLDALLGDSGLLVGMFVLAPFVPATLGAVVATSAVAGFAVLAGFLSPTWDLDFGRPEYWITILGLMVGGAFAIAAAAARRRARISSQRLAVLDQVGAIADGSLPLTETLERVVEMIVPAVADICMIDAIHDGRIVRAAVRAAGRPDAAEVAARIRRREPSVPDRFITAERSRVEVPHYRARMDPEDLRRLAHDPEDHEFLISLEMRSWVVAAMSARRRSLGTLTLLTSWSDRRYGPDDVGFAQDLANRIGLALDNGGLFSDLESVERRLDAVMSMLDEAVVIHDANGMLVYVNDLASRWLGFPAPEDALAAPAADLVDRLRVWTEGGAGVDTELIAEHLTAFRLPWQGMARIAARGVREERWVAVNSRAIEAPDGRILYAVTTAKDVTDLKRSEFAEQLLARTGELLASSIDYEETLQAVARVGVPQLADRCSVYIPDRNGVFERVAVAEAGPRAPGPDERTAQLGDGSPLAEVIRTRTPLLGSEIRAAGHEPDQAGPADGSGPGSTMAVPMTAGAKVIGALSFANGSESRRFDEADLRIAAEIARRASLAIENARLAGEHAEVAHVLQRGLAPPELPATGGFDLAALYRPAGEVNEVGGDFYDVFAIDGGWMVAIGDVMGRGAAAASLTGLARHTIRTAGRITGDPREAARLVDESLKRGPDLLLCSAIIMVLPETDQDPAPIPILVAGHPAPLLIRDRAVEPVALQGPLLGAPDEHRWELSTVELSAGDQLVLYTDGVTEARGASERFGDHRLRATLSIPAVPRAVVEAVEEALDSFIAREPEDDAAVLAIARRSHVTGRFDEDAPGADRISARAQKLGHVSTPREGVFRSPEGPRPRESSGRHPETRPPSHGD
ncbi:MAG: SpoIIE family protein phosphatase [Solirubrobacterales bacterium]